MRGSQPAGEEIARRFLFLVTKMRLTILRVLILAAFILSGCSVAANSAVPSTATSLPPTGTSVPTQTPTLTVTPLPPTPTPTPTPLPTIFPLPEFQSDALNADVLPQSYLKDTCAYLQERWDPENSVPGTVVLPIMYHSIVPDGEPVTTASAIGEAYFHTILYTAELLGFEAITTQQLVDFLYYNKPIPPRSMVLIVDDRKRGAYFDIFIPYLKKHSWKVVNAWISQPDTPAYLWEENRKLAEAGWVDFQAHGVIHNITLSEDALPEYVHQEIYGPLTAIPEHFNVPAPIAFIWPGGRFSAYAVQVAHEAGYLIGLTAYSRGPLMFNWVPLGAEERAVNDPLYVLPRAWSTNAANDLYKAAEIGDAAQAFAAQNRDSEIDWYNHYCANYPPIATSEAQP